MTTEAKPLITIEFECDEDMYEFLLEHQDRFCTNLPDDNSYRITSVFREGARLQRQEHRVEEDICGIHGTLACSCVTVLDG